MDHSAIAQAIFEANGQWGSQWGTNGQDGYQRSIAIGNSRNPNHPIVTATSEALHDRPQEHRLEGS